MKNVKIDIRHLSIYPWKRCISYLDEYRRSSLNPRDLVNSMCSNCKYRFMLAIRWDCDDLHFVEESGADPEDAV